MSGIEPTPSLRIESLPADFPGDLARLDSRVGQAIRAQGIPTGLEDRVLAATLAEVHASQEAAPLRLLDAEPVHRPSRPLWASPWTRLAMAAGLGLAFAIGWWAMNGTPPSGSGAGNVVMNDQRPADTNSRPAVLMTRADAGREFVTVSLQRMSPDSVTDMEGDFATLFQTGNETSYDDLSAEFAALVTELSPGEM